MARRFAPKFSAWRALTDDRPDGKSCSSYLNLSCPARRNHGIAPELFDGLRNQEICGERPKSAALFQRARKSLLGGVPMNWMARWAGTIPRFAAEAHGTEVVDVDGHRYVDFCLGDTGAMTGHAPASTVAAAQQQLTRGITLMLPNEDAGYQHTQRKFISLDSSLPVWLDGSTCRCG
jgi:hypothetical protein